jgi:hypothetical protein
MNQGLKELRQKIACWARPAILGTVIGSAGMNAFAFAAHTTTVWMTSAAVTLGIAIPALVYAVMRRLIAAHAAFGRHERRSRRGPHRCSLHRRGPDPQHGNPRR